MKIKSGEEYADFIKRIRLAAKITQCEIAFELGFTNQTISRWERGAKVPVRSQRIIDDFASKIKG